MSASSWHAMRSFSRDRSVTRQQLKPGTVRRIATYARPYRGTLAAFLLITSVDAVGTVLAPLLLGATVNAIIRRDTSLVLEIAAGVAALALLDALLSLAGRWYSARIGEGLIYDLRTQVFGHVQRQPIAFFTRAQTGSLVSRLNSDVIGAQQALTSTLSSVVSSVLQLILVLAAMFYYSWLVTVISLVLIPVFLIPARLVGRRLQRLTRESMQLDAAMGSTMTERFNVAGAMLVKLFGKPDNESQVFAGRAARVRDIGVVTAMYGSGLFIALTLLASLATSVVYGVGGVLSLHGALQICAPRPPRHAEMRAIGGGGRSVAPWCLPDWRAGRAGRAAQQAVRPYYLAVEHAGQRHDCAGQLRPGLRGPRPEAADRGPARSK